MPAASAPIPGVQVSIEDLVALRGQLAGLSLRQLRRRLSFRAGARETRVRGRGMEYEESRAYAPGDDVRTMDWRVMARTGEAHTKVFAEEKERRFLLAIDLSPTLFFGTRHALKSHAAAQAAAHVGWLANRTGARIGGLIVTADSHHEVRPGKTRAGLMGVFHHLVESVNRAPDPAGRPSRLNFLLRELQRVVKPGSIITLISDFIGLDEQSPEHVSALVRHNDINLFWIHDRTEVEAWPAGAYPVLIGVERHELLLRRNDPWIESRQRAHRQRIERLASSFNLAAFSLSCNEPIAAQLQRALRT